jgi:WS/DGAT/MGAT family acyltransferase
LFDLSPEPGAEPDPPEPDRPLDHRIPSGVELMATAMAARTLRPLEISRELMRTGQRLVDVVRLRSRPTVPAVAKAALPLSAPRTSFNVAVTRRRKVAFTAIGLADVKRLKNATGTTVNDVVLAVCAGALRTFLEDGDEVPDRPLVAVVPVSVRPDDDSAKGSNQVSAMFVQLPANLPDPLERLMAIREGTKGAKEEHNALGAHLLQDWSEYATPNVFANAARFYTRMRLADRHRPIANLVISNVPGPDFPLYLGGAELEAMFPLGPVMDGMGLNVTILSYRGVLYWGIITCREAMPAVWKLAAAIPSALDDLLAEAGEAPATYRSEAARAAVATATGGTGAVPTPPG